MKNFKQINNITGWIVFLIAAIVYMLTIEPTTSLWDCGEYILSAYKLEIGHPPGAPVFLILARIMTFFASDPINAAKMVNVFSALTSAFTILFLFWTITHLARKIFAKGKKMDNAKMIAVIASGIVGALTYTFSDSFWFSAVEGEVYATSSFLTAIVFWAILKWENIAHEEHADRWIILIAFLLGLSMGIHLLNLLAIPAVVFVYYFKKYKVTTSGVVKALLISGFILLLFINGIATGIAVVGSWFELLFVNGFGLPYFTGVFIYIILIITLLVFGIRYTIRKKKVLWNTVLLSLTAILIGYSTFSIVVIRSIADPPINENKPDNIFSLVKYLNREQYGDRPLIYGEYYNAPVVNSKEGKPDYVRKDGKYAITSYREKRIFDKRFQSVFPRMYSRDPNHISAYQEWGGNKGVPIRVTNNQGQQEILRKPSFMENMKFFFSYQVGHMYFRYFMWNFSGRQNDEQGHGGILEGNWISGIPFIDNPRIGDQSKIPEIAKKNRTRNVYFMLPFILGILGAVYSYRNGRKDFWIIGLLFVLNGLAIIIYLNQYPFQPRERDYAYVASFYAYAIWVGIGVLYLAKLLEKVAKPIVSAGVAGLVALILVPGIMASENWDDHDRSGRYTARDFAHNYLNSCAPNAIVFTNGDNDTFPLWYAQQVEGIRTDVRVCCLPYMITDWFIDQLKRQSYDSPPVPFTLSHDQYEIGKRDYIPFNVRVENYDASEVVKFIASDDPVTKVGLINGTKLDFVPTRKFTIPVDSAAAVNSGTVPLEDADKIVDKIEWEISSGSMAKSELMILDLIANNNWKRPIYFTALGHRATLGLDKYFRLEGYAYRFVPIRNDDYQPTAPGSINTDILYNNLMNKFKWGRMNEEDVFLGYYHRRVLKIIKVRGTFSRLADALIEEGKIDSAITVLDKCLELLPNRVLEFDYYNTSVAESYYKAGAMEKGTAHVREYASILMEELKYYVSLSQKNVNTVTVETNRTVAILQALVKITEQYEQTEINAELQKELDFMVNFG